MLAELHVRILEFSQFYGLCLNGGTDTKNDNDFIYTLIGSIVFMYASNPDM